MSLSGILTNDAVNSFSVKILKEKITGIFDFSRDNSSNSKSTYSSEYINTCTASADFCDT
jgi:hypothetical protein